MPRPTASPVAKLTPAPKPWCQACERPLKERQAGTEDDHLENSFMCSNGKCPMGGYCLTCLKLDSWLLRQNEALDCP